VQREVVMQGDRIELRIDATPGQRACTLDAKRSLSPSRARYSGLMPKRSRARNRRWRRMSQMAKANMP
jgi:hypothetical protein